MNIKEKDKTIVGYFLLIVGILLMFYSIISVIGVFTGGDVPIEILRPEEKDETTNAEIDPKSGNITIPDIDLSQAIEPMFPMFNVLIWLFIAFFILIAGGRVARVGIRLMKASIPDVTIIKSDLKGINYFNKPTENKEEEKKEKSSIFKRKLKQ